MPYRFHSLLATLAKKPTDLISSLPIARFSPQWDHLHNWTVSRNGSLGICRQRMFRSANIRTILSEAKESRDTAENTHYENMPIQIYENFTTKNRKFSNKNSDIFFHISAQNLDCGYSLEPPLRGGSNWFPISLFLSRNKKNNVYLCKPQFCYIKVGFKGVKII